MTTVYSRDILEVSTKEDATNKQTFIDNMTARGYKPRFGHNGNITATKGENTVRLVPLADHIVYIATPTMTAITRKGVTDDETPRMIDSLTV